MPSLGYGMRRCLQRLLSGEGVESEFVVEGCQAINHLDRSRDGHIGDNVDFPVQGGIHFVVVVNGEFQERRGPRER